MTLIETDRGRLIKSIKDDVDYTYGSWNPSPIIARYFEGHDWDNPQILIDFLPANRDKFKSMSNLIGQASPNFEYHQFGWCQLERCVIRCYAGKHENDRALNGRLLASHLADQTLTYILRNWDSLLSTMSAAIELYEPVASTDASIYISSRGSYVYIYEISFFIRTLFTWNDLPEETTEEVIMEDIDVLKINDEYIGRIDT